MGRLRQHPAVGGTFSFHGQLKKGCGHSRSGKGRRSMVRQIIFLLILVSLTASCGQASQLSQAAAYISRGVTFARNGDYNSASPDLDKAIQVKPDYADAYYWRAMVLKEQGKKTAAIVDLKKCIELTDDPNLHQAAQQALSELGAK
jgi:tetratricopeptide (TPR) repeat protein